jgi:hypothetical protein
MIQYSRFQDGGFVLHKIVMNDSRYSAWYSPDGALKDAERISQDGRTTYSVPARNRNVRANLERIGRMYANRYSLPQ